MKKTNDIILKLIENNISVNEICAITGLSHKQLFYRLNMLKIKGYDFIKKYYYNGEIVYDLKKDLTEDIISKKTILTSEHDNDFKALLISDIHFGNVFDTPELLYEIYNYCIKENINIIINTGDLVDGTFGLGGKKRKKITDINGQIEYLIKNYPFDKNILNFICLGNHDYSCLEKNGINLNNVLDNKRHDIISLGYGFGKINVKNDELVICHPTTPTLNIDKVVNKGLILRGHGHILKNIIKAKLVNIHLPSLSSMNDTFPSVVLANISFTNGIFNIGNFEHLIFINNKIKKISEFECELFTGKNTLETNIRNQDEYKNHTKEELDKILGINEENVKSKRLTQIEKFNKRYNVEKK